MHNSMLCNAMATTILYFLSYWSPVCLHFLEQDAWPHFLLSCHEHNLSWIHTKTQVFFFSTLSGELWWFHSDSKPQLGDKTLMQSIFRWLTESCHERETLLKLNFFQLMQRHHSWDSVLILILDRHSWPQKQKCLCKKAMKKRFVFEYEFSFNEPPENWDCMTVSNDALLSFVLLSLIAYFL